MLKTFIPSFPREVWVYTVILYFFIARKTLFDTAKEVGNYSVTFDSGTFLAIIGILGSFVVTLYNKSKVNHVIRTNQDFLSYYILAFLSFIWAGHFFAIAFKAIEVISCFLLVGITLLSLRNTKEGILYIIFLSTVITWSDIINYNLKYGLGFYHTNGYTFTALIGLLLAFGSIKFKIFKYKSLKYYIWLCLYGLLFGTSSASYISFLVGLIVLFCYDKKGINLFKIICIGGIICFLYYIASEIIVKYIFYGKSMATIENGTGRAAIWEAAYKVFLSHPIIGGGFVVAERDLGKWGINGINVLSAHNTFISVLVNTGIIGLLIFLTFIIKWVLQSFIKSNHNNVYARILFPPIIASLINCNSMPAIGSDWNYTSPCLYALIIFSFSIIFKLKHRINFHYNGTKKKQQY